MNQIEKMIYAAVWAQWYLDNTSDEKRMRALQVTGVPYKATLEAWEKQQASSAAEYASAAVKRFRDSRDAIRDDWEGYDTWKLYQEVNEEKEP